MPIPPNAIPAPDPGPLRYGLFQVATGPLELSDRARQSGVLWDPSGCGAARGYPAECDVTPPSKTFDANTPEQDALPFVVYATINCGSAGYTTDYLQAKVRRKLTAVEQTGVEEAVWSGAIGGSGALANKPTIIGATAGFHTNLGTAADLPTGISMLEDYASFAYGYVPTIHAEARVAAFMDELRLVHKDGPLLRTALGSKLAFGGGYPGTSPAGVAAVAGHAWLYVTGQVTLWRASDVFVAPPEQVLDRALNQYNLIAEREWLAAIDCFVAAVDVTL